MRMDHGRLLLGQEDQEYMDDVDGVNQVKEEDDGIVELGRGQTCVYIEDDEDGVGQVKNHGEGVRASWRLDMVDID